MWRRNVNVVLIQNLRLGLCVIFHSFLLPESSEVGSVPRETLQWALNLCYHKPDNPLYWVSEFPIKIQQGIRVCSNCLPPSCHLLQLGHLFTISATLYLIQGIMSLLTPEKRTRNTKQEAKSPATASPSPQLTPDIPIVCKTQLMWWGLWT